MHKLNSQSIVTNKVCWLICLKSGWKIFIRRSGFTPYNRNEQNTRDRKKKHFSFSPTYIRLQFTKHQLNNMSSSFVNVSRFFEFGGLLVWTLIFQSHHIYDNQWHELHQVNSIHQLNGGVGGVFEDKTGKHPSLPFHEKFTL